MNSTLKLTPISLLLLFCIGLALGYFFERPGHKTVKTPLEKRLTREQRRNEIITNGDLKQERDAQ